MSWTLDPRYVPANVKWAKKAPTHLGDTIAALQGRPRDVSTIKARPTTLSERLASAIVPDGRKWTDLRNKVSGAVDALTPLGAEQPLRDARSAYQGGNKWGAAGLGALAALGVVPGPQKGAGKAAKGIFGKRGIIAYHGSPHSFDKFSLDKIGTGEGAQAYGHGLYFAENEDVARSYRDALRADKRLNSATDRYNHLMVDGKPLGQVYPVDTPYVDDIKAMIAAGDHAGVRSHLSDRLARWKSLVGDASYPFQDEATRKVQAYSGLLDYLGNGGRIQDAGAGSMYQVRINANPEDFLDWDKPLYEQPETIRRALGWQPEAESAWHSARKSDADNLMAALTNDAEYSGNAYRTPKGLPPLDSMGADVVKSGSLFDNAKQVQVSGLLKDKGIPGIKYLDQGSRGAGEGSRNYVVFDDALIEILKKYGIAVPAMGLGIAGMSRQPEGGM